MSLESLAVFKKMWNKYKRRLDLEGFTVLKNLCVGFSDCY